MVLASLSESGSWRLVRQDADIRGWPLRETSGDALGTIVDLVIDTEHARVETIKLDTGKQYPVTDVMLGEGEAILVPSGGMDAPPPAERVEGDASGAHESTGRDAGRQGPDGARMGR